MNISAATDYGMCALLYLTEIYEEDSSLLATTEQISHSQEIPTKYLESILRQLRQAGIIESHRGPSGGFRLCRAPKEISVADVIRALDGPLAAVRSERPEDISYKGPASHLQEVWIAVRVSLREVLEEVNLSQIVSGGLPTKVKRAIAQPGAWDRRR